MKFSEQRAWTKENLDWLQLWYDRRIVLPYAPNLIGQKFFLHEEEFPYTMAITLVWSQRSTTERSGLYGPKTHHTISGFVQQAGRLPTPDDKVQLLAWEEDTHLYRPGSLNIEYIMQAGYYHLVISEARYDPTIQIS